MDDKLLEELLNEKSKGARRDRLLSRIAAIVLILALVAGTAFGALRFAGKGFINPFRSGDEQSGPNSAQTPGNTPEDTDPTEQQDPADDTQADQSDAQQPTQGSESDTRQPTEGSGSDPQQPTQSAGDDTQQPTEGSEGDPQQPTEQGGDDTAEDQKPATVRHELRVIWQEDIQEKPQTIYFQVRHAGEEVVLLELNAKKKWQVSWEDSYKLDELELRGKYPETLLCSVTPQGNDYIIHFEPGDGTANTSAQSGDGMALLAGTEELLPQTGVNWLAPAALLLAGTGLLGAGLFTREDRQEFRS